MQYEINGKGRNMERYRLSKKERLHELAQPMGIFCKQYRLGYTITKCIPNYRRLCCFHKRLHGPLQKDDFWRRRDRMGSFVVPPN